MYQMSNEYGEFMAKSKACKDSSVVFNHRARIGLAHMYLTENDDEVLEKKIMLTHYSAELLLPNEACQKLIHPALDSNPSYE